MNIPISLPRLALAMLVAGVVAAIMLALALSLGADGKLPPLGGVFWMSLFFCFFTLPIAAVFALPAGWLWQRFGPFRWWNCLAIGALCGVLGGYGFLRLVFVPTLQWPAALWFGMGGAAAGLALGLILGPGGREPRTGAGAR